MFKTMLFCLFSTSLIAQSLKVETYDISSISNVKLINYIETYIQTLSKHKVKFVRHKEFSKKTGISNKESALFVVELAGLNLVDNKLKPLKLYRRMVNPKQLNLTLNAKKGDIKKQIESLGFELISLIHENGYYLFGSKKLTNLALLKGLKGCDPFDSPITKSLYETLGAKPIKVDFNKFPKELDKIDFCFGTLEQIGLMTNNYEKKIYISEEPVTFLPTAIFAHKKLIKQFNAPLKSIREKISQGEEAFQKNWDKNTNDYINMFKTKKNTALFSIDAKVNAKILNKINK